MHGPVSAEVGETWRDLALLPPGLEGEKGRRTAIFRCTMMLADKPAGITLSRQTMAPVYLLRLPRWQCRANICTNRPTTTRCTAPWPSWAKRGRHLDVAERSCQPAPKSVKIMVTLLTVSDQLTGYYAWNRLYGSSLSTHCARTATLGSQYSRARIR